MKIVNITKNILFILIGILALFDMSGVEAAGELYNLRLELHLFLALILFVVGGCGLAKAIISK